MDVIFIKFIPRYDDYTEDIGVAINMKAVDKHIEELREKAPLCYGKEYGRFHVEVFKLIEE